MFGFANVVSVMVCLDKQRLLFPGGFLLDAGYVSCDSHVMGEAAERIRMTEEEYLDFERASEEKHEFIDGEIFAMSGCSFKHNRVTGAISALLFIALRGRRCVVNTPDMRIKIPLSRRYVYPDVSVVCGRAELKGNKQDILLNPRVVVEVLSDSTEEYDRGDKFTHYQSIPTLAHYVLAAQDKSKIEVFTKRSDGSWVGKVYEAGERVSLPAIECELDVDQVYAGVFDSDFDSGPDEAA